jgi:hypothetical protein
MITELITGNVKTALKNTQQHVTEFNPIEDQLKRNENVISLLVLDLADINETLTSDPEKLKIKIAEMEKINSQIRVLAETHAYLMSLNIVAKNGKDY